MCSRPFREDDPTDVRQRMLPYPDDGGGRSHGEPKRWSHRPTYCQASPGGLSSSSTDPTWTRSDLRRAELNSHETHRRAHRLWSDSLASSSVSTMAATLLTPAVATRVRKNLQDRFVSSCSSSPRDPLDSNSCFESPFSQCFSIRGRRPGAATPFVLRAAGALEEVGEGAFGEVHKGTDPTSGQTTAMKFLHLTSNGKFFRTLTEFQCMDRLSGCPNVLAVHDMEVEVRVEDGEEVMEGCILMPFCGGGDVRKYVNSRMEELKDAEEDKKARGKSKRMRKNAGLPELEAAALFLQMVKAVEACHGRGILHGDIKPENFLLTSRPQRVTGSETAFVEPDSVKLADFGLAIDMSLHEEERKRWLGGTQTFMAPEVVRSKIDAEYDESATVGLEADMWALGVSLYFMLSGRLPHMDVKRPNQPYTAALAGGKSVLEFKREEWAGVSRSAKSLVRMLLSIDKAKRPTAAQVLGHPWLHPSKQQKSAQEMKPKWRP